MIIEGIYEKKKKEYEEKMRNAKAKESSSTNENTETVVTEKFNEDENNTENACANDEKPVEEKKK
jgi:hypothetical protein